MGRKACTDVKRDKNSQPDSWLLEDMGLEEVFSYDEKVHGHVTKSAKRMLLARNIAAAVAGVLFLISIFDVVLVIKALAYFTGSAAYILELVIMTECFKVKPNHDELFMIYVFGPLYILMGISYLLH